MKNLLPLLSLLLLISCVSEGEQASLDNVANFYHTKASYSKGMRTAEGKVQKNFGVKVDAAPMIDSLNWDLVSSNIALMVYEGMSADERASYDEIAIEKNEEDAEKTFFKTASLASGLEQSELFTRFSKDVLAHDFDKIVQDLDPAYQSAELAGNLGRFFDKITAVHGAPKDFMRTGFGVMTTDDGEQLFHYSGFLAFEDGHNQPYFVTTDMDESVDYYAGLSLQQLN